MAYMPGRTTAEGYGWEHQRLRESLRPDVEAGRVDCWRCGERILPGAEWHLGHDDHDRTIYRGPEHAVCNLTAASREGHRRRGHQLRQPAAGVEPCWCGSDCIVHVPVDAI